MVLADLNQHSIVSLLFMQLYKLDSIITLADTLSNHSISEICPMEEHNFNLHPTLAADTCAIAELPLCTLLLSNDSSYPWTILVPRRSNISEIFQLSSADQLQLLNESSTLSRCLQSVLNPDKLNIAALGNMVPQLHIHHIARYTKDKAWPAPVWGHSAPIEYDSSIRDKLISDIYSWLNTQSDLLNNLPQAPNQVPIQAPIIDNHLSNTSGTTKYQLAQLNIATQQYPLDAPEMTDFMANIERINKLADDAPGFIWRLQTQDGDATGIDHFGNNVVVNMSIWTDIDTLHNYVYKSAHIEVLKRRREWFTTMRTYSVLWWVKSGTRPTIEEAADKLELLKKYGPHQDAFTFKRSWPIPEALLT